MLSEYFQKTAAFAYIFIAKKFMYMYFSQDLIIASHLKLEK